MKLLFDFFPILLFFVAYKFGDIYIATGVAIAATIAQLAYAWGIRKKVEPMLWMSAGVVVVFGGLTLVLHNPTFIKWKPTILYWAFGLSLAAASLIWKRNLIKKLMAEQIQLPEPVWARLNQAWIVFFAAMGALNLFVAYSFNEATWVNFKLMGTLALTFLFILGQALVISRHATGESS